MKASQELLDRAAALLADRRPIYEQMREAERERGFHVVVPAKNFWLDADDWDASCVVSVDHREVRIVAVLAKRHGSFRRLVASLEALGLTPVVICPIGPIMPAILAHYGWVKRAIGSGWELEEQWRPPHETDLKAVIPANGEKNG